MSARDRMVRILADAMVARGCTAAAAQGYAGHAADQLVDKAGGWLVYAGAIRHVELADRFGICSWEITTDEHPRDRETWENPQDGLHDTGGRRGMSEHKPENDGTEPGHEFFQAGYEYSDAGPYKAPELIRTFRCGWVGTHPTSQEPVAFGFMQSRVHGWGGTGMGPVHWAEGWACHGFWPLQGDGR